MYDQEETFQELEADNDNDNGFGYGFGFGAKSRKTKKTKKTKRTKRSTKGGRTTFVPLKLLNIQYNLLLLYLHYKRG
jgi:hypothetical protein